MRNTAKQTGRTAMVAHEFRYTPQRAYIRDLLADSYIGKFELCTIELFLDRFASREPRPLTWAGYKSAGGGVLGALGSHYVDALRFWFGEIASVSGRLDTLRPDLRNPATGQIVKFETDDTFAFTVAFKNGGLATMNASFAVTPARGPRIVVMGDNGTLIAEQPGPNPMEDGVVIASRSGSPLQALPGPQRPLARRRHRAGAGTGSTTAAGRPCRGTTGVGAARRCALSVGDAARAHL